MRNPLALLFTLLLLLSPIPVARAQLAKPGSYATIQAALPTENLQPGQQTAIAIVLDIKPGFHAQSNKPLQDTLIPCEVTLTPNPALTVYAPQYPPGKIENYPALGKLSVYTGKTIIYVPIEVKSDAPQGPIQLKGEITYQICDDKSCFPPETTPFSIDTLIAPATRGQNAINSDLFKDFNFAAFATLAKPVAPRKETIKLFGVTLQDNSYPFAFVAAFLIGIIFNVMPCVLPVVPLKAIGFYKVAEENRAKSIALGAVFSLGIVATFALLGLVVVVLRRLQWGELYANPWFLAAIVIILAVFAFSMFGVFTVNLPTGIYSFVPRHDTFTGNFLFGILTAILSTPCTFGLFLGLLIWATYQPPLLGLSLVTMVGLGMAFPYLILSAFPELARRMPRTGPWAELVKQMMGFLLLLSAVFFARRFIEGFIGSNAFWWSLFAVVAAAGLFLITRTIQLTHGVMPRLVAAALALLMIFPAGAFAYRITNPPIAWKPYSRAALADARAQNRIVMVEFTAAWCSNCIYLETTVFDDERTVQALKQSNAITLRADLTRTDAPGWALLRQVSRVGAVPLTIIYSPKLADPIQLTGVYSTDNLLEALNQARN